MLTYSYLASIFGAPSASQQYIPYLSEAFHTYAEPVGIILGMLALALAFKQLRDSQRLLSEMSTQFANVFPYNLSTIIELMGKASSRVDIMVDIVGYGHYSAPEEFTKYQNKIYDLAKDGVPVRMLVYGKNLTATTRDEQFGGKKCFEDIKKSVSFRRYFKVIRKGYPEPKDYEAFIKILDEKEQAYEEEAIERGANVQSAEEPFRFFLWLIDEAEAVFSFQTHGEHFDEICFRTRDGHLIKTFTRLFSEAWGELEKGKAAALATQAGVAPPAAQTAPPAAEAGAPTNPSKQLES
jgi:hypothetical protein